MCSNINKICAKRFIESIDVEPYKKNKMEINSHLHTIGYVEDNSDIIPYFTSLRNELKYARSIMYNNQMLFNFTRYHRDISDMFEKIFSDIKHIIETKYLLCKYQCICKYENICGYIHSKYIKDIRYIYNKFKDTFEAYFKYNKASDASILIRNLMALQQDIWIFVSQLKFGKHNNK